MPHSEAVQELIAAAESIKTRLSTLPVDWKVSWAREEVDLMLTAKYRLEAAVARVKAEEKSQAHCPGCRGPILYNRESPSGFVHQIADDDRICGWPKIGLPANAPVHQIGGKS